jgi:hypothetical protein
VKVGKAGAHARWAAEVKRPSFLWLYFYNHLVAGGATYLEAHAHLNLIGYLVGQLHDNLLQPAKVRHRAKILDRQRKNQAE